MQYSPRTRNEGRRGKDAAKVVEAEADVPALAEVRQGKLGVMDYYNMRNIMADTDMRQSIGRSTKVEDLDDQRGDELKD